MILMGKRELVALLNLSSWCLVMVGRLFLTVPRGCLQFVIVVHVFPDHTHLLFEGRFSFIFCYKLPSWRPFCPHSFPSFYLDTSKVSTIRLQLHSIQFKKENGFETYFPYHTIFSLIIGFHLGRHLGYFEILNDARVASLGFFKDNVCTTRINKEKKNQVPDPPKIHPNSAGLQITLQRSSLK